jgi:sugar O-acyltransferase (sialic acid O-acetyltransferase NeuD family)
VSRNNILVIGAGGHARACIDVIEQLAIYDSIALVGSPIEVGKTIMGWPILGTDEDLPKLLDDYPNALIGIGQIKSPNSRIRLFDHVSRMGFLMPTIISPLAYASRHSEIGEGTIVMHRAVINANVKIGRNCIVNSMSLIEHDVTVADHCHVSTAAVLNGAVEIGEGSFVGSHASIRESIKIPPRSVIGIGECVKNRPAL